MPLGLGAVRRGGVLMHLRRGIIAREGSLLVDRCGTPVGCCCAAMPSRRRNERVGRAQPGLFGAQGGKRDVTRVRAAPAHQFGTALGELSRTRISRGDAVLAREAVTILAVTGG